MSATVPEQDLDLEEAAAVVRMSTRWVRDRIKYDNVEHIRRGRKIFFTREQVEKLRLLHVKAPAPVESITTGRKRRS